MTEKLTLNKFRRGSGTSQKVTLPTAGIQETLEQYDRRQIYLKPETYSIPALTRFAAPFMIATLNEEQRSRTYYCICRKTTRRA